jgi:hypothetical protein
MQPMRIAPFENVWAQSVDLLNKQLAAAIDLQLWLIEMLQFTEALGAPRARTAIRSRNDSAAALQGSGRISDRASVGMAARDLNDRIGIWVNEGGAGGEVNR